MTELEAADELCRLAALMVDYMQGYVMVAPLEELGGAITRYRTARATMVNEW